MNITYKELLDELKQISSIKSNKNMNIVVKSKLNFLGIYVPKMKQLAKRYKNYNFIGFKFDKYYEINFIYAYANLLKLENNLEEQVQFILNHDYLFESWAIVDSCAPLLKGSTLETCDKFIKSDKEFIMRFAYLILLPKVRNEMMINEAFNIIINDRRYYVIMAEAWLLSECLISSFDQSFKLLKQSTISSEIKLIAIQKSIDSFRVSDENKNKLRNYRRLLRGRNYDK